MIRLLIVRLIVRDKFGNNFIEYVLGLMREKGSEVKGVVRRCSSFCSGVFRGMGFEGV